MRHRPGSRLAAGYPDTATSQSGPRRLPLSAAWADVRRGSHRIGRECGGGAVPRCVSHLGWL